MGLMWVTGRPHVPSQLGDRGGEVKHFSNENIGACLMSILKQRGHGKDTTERNDFIVQKSTLCIYYSLNIDALMYLFWKSFMDHFQ